MYRRRTRSRLTAALALTLTVTTGAVLGPAVSATATDDEGFGPGAEVVERFDGSAGFVGTQPGKPLGRPEGIKSNANPRAAAQAFVQQNRKQFGLDRRSTVAAINSNVLSTGNTTVRLQQKVDGYEVLGGELAVQLDDDNRIVSTLGETLPAGAAVDRPLLTARAAESVARKYIAQEEGLKVADLKTEDKGIKIFDPRIVGGDAIPKAHTVFEVEVTSGLLVRHRVFVEATLGAVIASFDEIHTAKVRGVCDQRNMRDTAQGHNAYCRYPVLQEGQSTAGHNTDVVRAFNYAGATYDFFKREFNRDSLDGKGMQLSSVVRYCQNTGPCPWPNAAWTGAGMIYGQGFANADDVVAHELMHGITDHTSRLFYFYQSGAINESMSDVFGEFVDWQIGGDSGTNRWKLGEDIPGGAIRDMANPNAYGSPARMRDPKYWTKRTDNGGVHYNSGVGNKTAQLATDGGSFNGQRVTGMGWRRVAAIWYETNTGLLTSASDYQDLGRALRQACRNLTGRTLPGGPERIDANHCANLDRAIKATELDKPRPGAVDKRVCKPGRKAKHTFFDNLEKKPRKRWKAKKPFFVPGNRNGGLFDATYSTSGTKNLWGFDRPGHWYPNRNKGKRKAFAVRTKRKIKVPKNGRLRFNHAYMFDIWGGKNASGGRVEYSFNGKKWRDVFRGKYPNKVHRKGSAYSKKRAFAGESGGFRRQVVKMPKKTHKRKVHLRFRIGSDANTGMYSLGWFIDDIGVYRCRK